MLIRKLALILLVIPCSLFSQDPEVISIHQLELMNHARHDGSGPLRPEPHAAPDYMADIPADTVPLTRRIFGYHPYWGGSNYLNYRWGLLSDLCHFSYEVDPVSGLPVTTHDWDTSPAIDSALAHGVKVHLCVTLFSGHSIFFPNLVARQTLIEQVIGLILQRGAHGVNMDVEALPLSQKAGFHAFMADLCSQVKAADPDLEVSIAAPAVNWSEKFDVPLLAGMIDFFMVMGYDYYWSGSSLAGPVSPLYPMTGSYNYSFSRTISYYQSQDVPPEKIVMGVPYYAYQWKTEGPTAPSPAVGPGAAYTYRYIKDNTSGQYSSWNKQLEPNSFSPYFAFESNGWYQCFLDDAYSLGEKYDIVNRRGLGGIGIWALGYDNGHQELWDLIAAKFTTLAHPVDADTLYDTGGPAFDYYSDEGYTYTITTRPGTSIYLSFSYLDTEAGYDTLWIFNGTDTAGIYTGDAVPPLIHSDSNVLVLRFSSDGATEDAGWRAVYDTVPVSGIGDPRAPGKLEFLPNPASGQCLLDIPADGQFRSCHLLIFDGAGRLMAEARPAAGDLTIRIDASGLPAGMYTAVLHCGNGSWTGRLMVVH